MKPFSLAALCGIALLSACQKQPTACFNVEYINTIGNDHIYEFTNCSSEAHDFIWDFGDGTISTVTNPRHTYHAAGDYTITLTGKSENNRKEDVYTESIHIQGEGLATFWCNTGHVVTLNIQTQDPITISTFPGTPSNCESGIPVPLPEGTYTYTAAENAPGTLTWNGTLVVTNGSCILTVFE
jgi:PKD repeat protein